MRRLRKFLRWFSLWHRGYDRGYDTALRHVENGLQLSMDMAKAYGHQSLDDATKAIARSLMVRR